MGIQGTGNINDFDEHEVADINGTTQELVKVESETGTLNEVAEIEVIPQKVDADEIVEPVMTKNETEQNAVADIEFSNKTIEIDFDATEDYNENDYAVISVVKDKAEDKADDDDDDDDDDDEDEVHKVLLDLDLDDDEEYDL